MSAQTSLTSLNICKSLWQRLAFLISMLWESRIAQSIEILQRTSMFIHAASWCIDNEERSQALTYTQTSDSTGRRRKKKDSDISEKREVISYHACRLLFLTLYSKVHFECDGLAQLDRYERCPIPKKGPFSQDLTRDLRPSPHDGPFQQVFVLSRKKGGFSLNTCFG